MFFSLIKNDRSTAKDEAVLFGLILVFFLAGLALFITAPSFWIVDAVLTKGFGFILIITALILVPGLIYRLMTNYK